MGVLGHADPGEFEAIIARLDLHRCEAGFSTFLWAALIDAANAVDDIILHVPGPVELLIANWIRARIAGDNNRNLVVNVQVLGASRLTFTGHTTTVTGHDMITIGITLVVTISEMVLAGPNTEFMVVNGNFSSLLVDAFCIRPHSIMVNLGANGCAVLVIFLTGIIHTGLRTTLGEKLLLGVMMEEDIKVALDLLGG